MREQNNSSQAAWSIENALSLQSVTPYLLLRTVVPCSVDIVVDLSSMGPNANVAVIGATGGLGAAFVRALSASETISTVHAISRAGAPFDDGSILSYAMDLLDEESVAVAAKSVAQSGPLDLIVVATGLLHRDELQPEKTMREINAADMLDVFAVNTVGPALVAKHFLPIMSRNKKSVFAALSARVGSIDDNRLGGWVSYRASKAALNMTVKTLAIEHARRFPEAVLITLHPGTVATDLSAPFRSRVPPESLFDPETSAAHLLRVIEDVRPADSGALIAWDGRRIPF
jgi:NAD(P)-dependent dehydrogenase (short-subunit alcohol dehydrogenase family)